MEFVPLGATGVFGIISAPLFDDRGSFARVWDQTILGELISITQVSVATNPLARTLRGIHFQAKEYAETKIVQCITGLVFDVVVDLREESSTYKQYFSVLLGPNEKFQGIVIPKGFAHGYLTLMANSTLLYFMDQIYVPESAQGIAWDDQTLQINWPSAPLVISSKDRQLPMLKTK